MKIRAAAIFLDGKIYTGFRHHKIIHQIYEDSGIRPVTGKQGFVTDTGLFVDRAEAARIAIAAGQITETKYHFTDLFSEEMWDVIGNERPLNWKPT